MTNIYLKFGEYCYQNNDLEQALHYFIMCKEIYEDNKHDTLGYAETLKNIGNIYLI